MLDLIVVLGILIAAYMAWNIGANDVANAMGTSVGSGALTLRRAIIVAAVFEFLGAVLFGSHVTDTIRKGVLTFDEAEMELYSERLMYGFMAALLAAAIWLTVATKWGMPVSTTHSIVGGVIGMGLYIHPAAVNWGKVLEIVLSWIASPLLGGILAFVSFWVIKKVIMEHDDPLERTRRMAPLLALPTFFVLGLALQFKALKGFYKNIGKEHWLPAKNGTTFNPLAEGAWIPLNALFVSLAIGVAASLVMYLILRRFEFKEEGYAGVERVFIWLQIITACYVAFAHGANDVANAIGPMAAIYQIATDGVLVAEASVPLWLLLLGGAGITVGVATWGYKVMDTIGKKITHITPSRGFAAEFGAATTVLIFSMPFLAVPISTTHTLVGAVVGVGLAGGASAVDFRVFAKIAASWVASLPIAGVLSVIFFILFALNPNNVLVVSVASVGAVIYIVTREDPAVEEAEVPIVVSEMPMGEPVPGAARSVFSVFHDHALAVEETVEHMLTAVNAAVAGEDPSEAIKATQEAELSADVIKSDIRDMLGTGVRLAVNKEVFLHMLARQDRIADYAQNVAEQLSFRPLYEDEEARALLLTMAEAVSATVAKYEDTVEFLHNFARSGFAKREGMALRTLIREVNKLEHLADEAEVSAASHVFSAGDDEPLAAMHMYRVLQRLDDVANACEKAANAFLPLVLG
jgi:PiT family inorganic phosphate transporter